MDGSACAVPEQLANLIGGFYLEMAGLLGRRTAELHLTLARGNDPAWRAEEYSTLYQRSVYQSLRNQARAASNSWPATRELPSQSPRLRPDLAAEKEILDRCASSPPPLSGNEIRIHGNFTLQRALSARNS